MHRVASRDTSRRTDSVALLPAPPCPWHLHWPLYVNGVANLRDSCERKASVVLHTEEPHPHVHMVIKAVSEDGVRLNIRKGWMAAAEILDHEGQQDLAWHIRRFTETLPPVRTNREPLRERHRPREHRPRQQELTR